MEIPYFLVISLSQDGTTPLYWASEQGKADCVAYLASVGADVNKKESEVLKHRGKGCDV